MPNRSDEVTQLLQEWRQGDGSALERLMPLVFEELRLIAHGHFKRESAGHTLQPTALVNEAFLKLLGQRDVDWQNRKHFFGVAAILMRRILVDYAKARTADKRGGAAAHVPLDDSLRAMPDEDSNLVALDAALERLALVDARQARIVELRTFTGLTNEEIADVLEVSPTTVKREWRLARFWLFRELQRH